MIDDSRKETRARIYECALIHTLTDFVDFRLLQASGECAKTNKWELPDINFRRYDWLL